MTTWTDWLFVLAEEAAQQPQPNLLMWMIPAMLIFFLFQMFFTTSPAKREQKHIDQLKSTLKKNDPVVTAGGILGTVANVSPDKNEITVKVDDNTRIRVQMRSVMAVVKGDDKPTETKSESADKESA